jgi:hypothetical protein
MVFYLIYNLILHLLDQIFVVRASKIDKSLLIQYVKPVTDQKLMKRGQGLRKWIWVEVRVEDNVFRIDAIAFRFGWIMQQHSVV